METIGAGVGPLSALGDGHMVGMVRNPGDVYLFKLKNDKDATKGIEAVKIVENVGGDPYMYTDFTGATLYLTGNVFEFDFTNQLAFDAKVPLRQLELPGRQHQTGQRLAGYQSRDSLLQ